MNLLNGFDWQEKLAIRSVYAQDPELSFDPNSLDPLQNYAINPKPITRPISGMLRIFRSVWGEVHFLV